MWFEGSIDQNLNATSVPKLRVDNGNLLILGDNLQVGTQVDLMNNGNVQLNGYDLVVLPGGTIIGYDNLNHFITNGTGSLGQTIGIASGSIVFPVGRTSYNPAFLTNVGVTDLFKVRVEDLVYQQGTSGPLETVNIVDRTWLITEETAGGSVTNLTLRWSIPDEVPTFDRTNCSVTHWNGSGWITYGYSNATNVGSGYYEQTWPGLTSFSPFAVQDDNEPLPVTLLDFQAIRLDAATARLDWSTENEVNSLGFGVERRLDHETAFSEVGWVDGAGNSSTPRSYDLRDPNGYSGLSHYRLRMVDIDGDFSYSEVRTISGMDGQPTITMWPNPVAENLNLQFDHFGDERVMVQIWSAEGKQIFSKPLDVHGSERFTITETSQLSAGMYSVQIYMEGKEMFVQKFLKLGLGK
jgi:hypothetical protein